MRYGIASYTRIDPDTIADKRKRRRVIWYARAWYATPAWADRTTMRRIGARAKRLRAAGQAVEVDHTVPLFHSLVCGLNNEFNLRIVPREVNQAKSNHTWPDMPGETVDLFNSPWEPEQYALPL